MELPAGLDVFEVLVSALRNAEYRDKLLFVVGSLFGLGFMCGVLVCAIFSRPDLEVKGRRYEREVERRKR